MKNRFILSILLFIAPFAFAEDQEGAFRGSFSVGVSASVYQSFFTVSPALFYDFGLPALGGGAKIQFGMAYADIYAAPYLGAELGWVYLHGGFNFLVKGPDPAASANGFVVPQTGEDGDMFLPYLALGIAPPLFKAGPGSLGLDIGLAIAPSASPVEIQDGADNILGDILATMLGTVFGAVFNLIKLGLSLSYTIAL